MARGKWWEIYNDTELNALEEQVSISNQNLMTAEAQFLEAKFAVRIARSNLYPTISAAPSIVNERSPILGISNFVPKSLTAYDLPVDVSYQADIWGSIRRSIQASAEAAQVSAAQLENARLSYQSELAQDYFELRGTDGEKNCSTRLLSPIRTTSSSHKTGLIMVWPRARMWLKRRPNWKLRGLS